MAEEGKLTVTAQAEFSNGNYSNSLNALSQLLVHKPSDPKVFHNKAVVEFHLSGHRNFETFQKNLNYLYNVNRININDSEAPDDIEFCILYYNQAIIYYLQRQYEAAIKVMDKIFSLIQPMEENLAQKVSLFYVELHILTRQYDKALNIISIIENQVLARDTNGGATAKTDKEQSAKGIKNELTMETLRDKLGLCKARCNLLQKDYMQAQKDLEVIHSSGKQSFSSVLMKAQLELCRHNYKRAEEILTSIQEDVNSFYALNEARTFIFYNNMGLLYHYLGKPGVAKYYLCSKGFGVCLSALEKISQNPRDPVCGLQEVFTPGSIAKFKYNVGVALLFAKKPNEAFEYLTEASQVMHTSPLLWLRLAECCILVHNPNNSACFDFKQRRRDLVLGAVGTGEITKILLNNRIYKDSTYSSSPQSFAIPGPNLDFATLCIRNAKRLIPKKNVKLKMAVHIASAYINLTVGNPLEALRDAELVMEDENDCDLYKYLARMSMGEALLMLNRVHDAIEVLNPTHYKDYDPSQEKLFSAWCPKNKISTHTAIQYNLAVVLATKGELEKSAEILKRIWVSRGPKGEVPIHVISLAIYIELVLGHVDIARTIIRQNCPHIFS